MKKLRKNFGVQMMFMIIFLVNADQECKSLPTQTCHETLKNNFSQEKKCHLPRIIFEPKERFARQLHQYTTEIQIADLAQGLGGFEFTITFEASVMNAVEVVLGDFMVKSDSLVFLRGPNIDNEKGVLYFAAFSWDRKKKPKGQGTLAKITWFTSSIGESHLDMMGLNRLYNENGAMIDFHRPHGGRIIVNKPAWDNLE